MMYPAKFVLLATQDDEQGLQEAQAYVRDMKFTSEDARIRRVDGDILVITKKEVKLF